MAPSLKLSSSCKQHQAECSSGFDTSRRSPIRSFKSSTSTAEASNERYPRDGSHNHSQAVFQDDAGDYDDFKLFTARQNYPMAASYYPPSFVASAITDAVGSSALTIGSGRLANQERETAPTEEGSLRRSNHHMTPKHPWTGTGSPSPLGGRLGNRLSNTGTGFGRRRSEDEESALPSRDEDFEASETTTLLGDRQAPYASDDTPDHDVKEWEETVNSGKIPTEWQQEAKVLARYSSPLILTFMLQYSLTIASIFSVGHIGKTELGAVSLAGMTANITGYAVYQGLATSLDTLCAQAYGSGNKTLVGLHLQRMVYFLWVITIPIGMVWLAGTQILKTIVPDQETAALAGLYLKIILAGAPGLAAFEGGKRFVQAQGLFCATLYVLLFCAPFNAFLNWLFVWHFGWGFVGAPIAVASTANLLPICLFLYVRFVDGRQCWGGFSRKAFQNWGPMIQLAIPGLLMVLAEYLAFEILTLSASWISSTHLAAQSVLTTLSVLTCQIAFPLSVGASTRIANLIGAALSDTAKTSGKVALIAACLIGACNMIMLSSLRNYLPWLLTSDADVANLVAEVLSVCAAVSLFDAVGSNCNGILRGLGKQKIGGWVALFSYYAVAIPISFGTGFGLHWDLYGLWAGPGVALCLIVAIEGWFIYHTSWERAVEVAMKRNARG